MKQLQGHHGTCREYGESILKNGFTSSQSRGHRGSGVYFWNKGPLSEKLAFEWANHCKQKGYSGAKDKSPDIIESDIDVHEDHFIDLEDPEITQMAEQYMAEKYANSSPHAHTFWVSFFYELERSLKAVIKVVQAKLTGPDSMLEKSKALGGFQSLVVRDLTCIKHSRRVANGQK